MTVEVNIDGRPWTIGVEACSQPGEFTVLVNGRPRAVSAAWIDADTLSVIDGTASHEVRLHRYGDGRVGVGVAGTLFDAAVARPGWRKSGKGDRDADRSSAALVKAPMPGRVVRLLVAVGDRVHAQQGLIVVEAMKMENELRSPAGGTVKEIAVAAGAAVEAGALLVVIGD